MSRKSLWEVVDTLIHEHGCFKEQDFATCYIEDNCVKLTWDNPIQYRDGEGNVYHFLDDFTGPGETHEITNFIIIAEDSDGDDPENLKKVLQQKVIFK